MNTKINFSFSNVFQKNNRIPIHDLENGKCQNCGYEFRGHFCPDCGQEVAEFNRPFGFILYDFMGNFFAFDTRLFKTFKYLLSYPGFLTKEFFQGKRTRYSPPFRIFVFLSFVLFLLLSFLTDIGLDSELKINGDISAGKSQKAVKQLSQNTISLVPEIEKIQLDSIYNEIIKSDSLAGNINLDLSTIFTGKGNLRSKLNQTADILEKSLPNEEDPRERQRIQEYITMCRTPEILISAILKYLSWASFLMLPVFALILKIFYFRRKKFYIQHLIFSIHLHSFVFIILIIVTLLRLIFKSVPDFINLVFFASFPVYLLIAMRNFYTQSWPKTAFKLVGIGLIYNFSLVTVVLMVFLKSLQII